MRKILFALTVAALPALALSACSGSNSAPASGMSALPNVAQHGRVHRNDTGPGDLHAGGSSFADYAYNLGNQPTGLYTGFQAIPPPGSVNYGAEQTFGNNDQVYYCSTGSGTGRKEFTGAVTVGASACAALGLSPVGFGGRGDPIDFVGSDAALASTECCGSGTPYNTNYESTYGQPFEIPVFGGPVAYGYINTSGQGLTGLGSGTLKLSTWTSCAITNGTIGYWDDPAITADNGGTAVAGHQPISFFYRSDGSGTTYAFELHLANSASGCNQTFRRPYNKAPYASGSRSAAWTFPPVSTSGNWTGPTGVQPSGSVFEGESGNPGVLEGIQGTLGTGFPYATGYVEGAWVAGASSPSVSQAALLTTGNTFVKATDAAAVALALKKANTITYGEGDDGASLGSSTPWCQLFVNPALYAASPYKPALGAYPIVSLTYLDFYGKHNGSHYPDLKKYITYFTGSAINTVLGPLEYSPLITKLKRADLAALKGSASHAACLNS
ncbi:MAG TPA: substrate-binding domain-containing protein [Candidatus Cybelea sp.]